MPEEGTPRPNSATAQSHYAISDGPHAKRRGELMDLITSLRTLGTQSELDLPRIVCIGNQSAGKSSLVEAISGIQVPRDSGTCTRCPMECRLAPSAKTWSAQVSLRKEYDDTTKTRLPEPETVSFGFLITDAKDTELVLRRAQLAILNPSKHPEDFIQMDLTSEDSKKKASRDCELEFSNNVVCIDIWAPDLAQLVFIDLPGIIQNADKKLVDLIETMVIEYIRGNSIILVTIPMTDDLQNQKAARLAKLEDPDGVRTIVALTKVDLVGNASTKLKETWLNAIEGRGEHPVKHGYFGTRQLDDGEREKTSPSKARALEKQFFAETQPWCTSKHRKQFGIPNLTEKLSALLAESIQKSLPRIHEDLRVALSTTAKALQACPSAMTGEPSSEVLTLVGEFCKDLKRFADGARGAEKLVQANFAEFRRFKKAIRSTAPNFRPFESSEEDTGEIINGQGVLEGEIDDIRADPECFLDPIYLPDVGLYIKQAKTRELPANIPLTVISTLIEKFTTTWAGAVETCLEAVRQNVLNSAEGLIVDHFKRFSHLETTARDIIMDEVERRYQKTKEIMNTILSYESMPYTQNDHYFQVCREKFFGHYRSVRQNKCVSAVSTPEKEVHDPILGTKFGVGMRQRIENEAVSALVRLGFQVTAADLDKLAVSDEYEEEMLVASQVRAFFQVSYKRIIDMIPMSMDHLFLRALSMDMQKILILRLELGDKEKAQAYLVEDPGVASNRRDLKIHMDKLEKARNHLFKLGSSLSA